MWFWVEKKWTLLDLSGILAEVWNWASIVIVLSRIAKNGTPSGSSFFLFFSPSLVGFQVERPTNSVGDWDSGVIIKHCFL